ncbi:MAG: glutamate--tRNA ligase [Candidatus Aminicenantes bacterium]|nr:glutamate--tRNA ligase [Candidatus Aminicenantes bacterium]
MIPDVRVRFAPSPTGYLHVGGARTALFNYLFARHHKGVFILRIEDTDRKRFQAGGLAEIFQSLKWMQLEWDEGPEKNGDFGPYIQSERKELYHKHAELLLEEGKAYRCFCTPERLAKLREEQQKTKMQKGSGYDRHCLNLSTDRVNLLLASGKPYVIRYKIPTNRIISFTDIIRGKIEYQSEVLDDFIVLKSDGFPTYHLANVVDDHHMRISHILRGDEWIASTPRHMLLYEAFGWDPPQFAHMPVILAREGGKLSKRKGAVSVLDYKKSGYLPEALVNFLALLGWSPGEDRELMSRKELITFFSLDKVSPKASVFDEKKLEWMNGCYIREQSVESLFDEVFQQWKDMGIFDKDCIPDQNYCRTVIRLMKDRAKRIQDIAETSGYFFKDPGEYDPKSVKKHFKADTVNLLKTIYEKLAGLKSFDQNILENEFRDYAHDLNISAGKLIHPTRLAISGKGFGPGLFELMEILGKETVLRRIKNAIQWVTDEKQL